MLVLEVVLKGFSGGKFLLMEFKKLGAESGACSFSLWIQDLNHCAIRKRLMF